MKLLRVGLWCLWLRALTTIMPDTPATPLFALHTFLHYLEALAASGQKRVWMSPEARTALREVVRMKPGRMTFAPRPVAEPEPVALPIPEVAEVMAATAAAPEPVAPVAVVNVVAPASVTRVAEEAPAFAIPREMPAPVAPAVVAPAPAVPVQATPAPYVFGAAVGPDEDKFARLSALRAAAEAAPEPRALGSLRDILVFGTGDPDARIMLVGDAPGAEEESAGEPFSGRAGILLGKLIIAMGMERQQLYLTNVCKYRPAIMDRVQGNLNRQPTAGEMQSCARYLKEEIRIVQPGVIVALGGAAVTGLLGGSCRILNERGHWREYMGIPVMPTLHPMALLQAESMEDGGKEMKSLVWTDMLSVMERLEIPITPRQRRFFGAR